MTTFLGRGLAPERDVLANGAVVVVKESRATPAVTINATLQAGSMFDSAGRPGLAYFLSRVLDRGTVSRSADEIADVLDARGVSLNISVSRHTMTLVCTCLAEDFEAILDLLGTIVREPMCPEEELEKRCAEVITVLRQDEDNPAAVAIERVMELLYGADHPYGWRGKGTPKSLEGMDRATLLGFHAERFAPATLGLVIVGDVETANAMAAATLAFGGWRALSGALPTLPPPPVATNRRQLVVTMMNKAQADIAYGFVAIRRSDPAYHAYSIMNNVLGQYSLGGRLGDSIRERQGMAYYVFSALDASVIEGPLLIRTGVGREHVDRAIASIDEEVARLAVDGISDQELTDSRRYLIGSIPRMLETNTGIANFLQLVEQFGLGLDYDVRLPDLLEAVTLDAVQAAASRVLSPERATIVVAGPYESAGSA